MFSGKLKRKHHGPGYLSIVAMTVVLFGCSDGELALESPVPATRDVEPSTLQGVWENRGYGRILSIEQGVTYDYQVNSTSCQLNGEFLPHELDGFLVEVRLAADNQSFDTISEYVDLYTHSYTFSRLDAVPDTCDESNIVRATDDPMVNYEMLWQTMEDNYAFFELRGVDWHQVDQSSRPLASQITDADALFELFLQMLTPLKDGHVKLIVDELNASWDAGFAPDWFLGVIDYFQQENTEDELQNAFEQQSEYVELDAFVGAQFGQFFTALSERQRENVASYFDTAQCDSNTDMCWGVSADNIGYLSIDRMHGYEEPGTEPGVTSDLDVLRPALDSALMTLGETAALIIDIRLNQGGEDRVALEIAGRFSAVEQVAYRKKVRSNEGFANEHVVNLVPSSENPYMKPIYLLVSAGTYSAAEGFALTMKGLPNVTLVGEPTGGIFSDAISKTLPNGWKFTLSSEIYSDLDGHVYEGTGIPVDQIVDFFVVENILAGRDPAIERVFAQVSEGPMDQQR